jgi:hypothetical protein
MKIVLATGQSNMIGLNGFGGPAMNSTDPRITVWNNENPIVDDGTAWISSPAAGNKPWAPDGSNNLSLWFCQRLAQELQDDVRLILVARGGNAISHWHPASGEVYARILSVYAATGLDRPADILLWHQGESDAASDEATYKAAWLNVMAGLASEDIIDGNTARIVGGLRPSSAVVNPWLQALAAENPNTYYADATGMIDGVESHFLGNRLYQFGYGRYWDAYTNHIGPQQLKGDPLRWLMPGI